MERKHFRFIMLLLFTVIFTIITGEHLSESFASDLATSSTATIQAPFKDANIDWQKYKGETIKVLLSGHPIQGTIMGLLKEFKELTGIEVIVDVLPEEEFFEKLNIDFEKGRGKIDVFMTSPLYHWRYAKEGWIEGLNKYLENVAITDKKWYDTEDFFPLLWKTSRWDGTIGGGIGKGEIYSIPVWWEGCMLMYRKDLGKKYNFTEPKSWKELYQQLANIPKQSNGKMYGFIGRGIRSWSQIHTYHMTMMASQGAVDLDSKTAKAAFNSPTGIEVGKYWVKMLLDAGSSNWPNYNWYEVSSEFQAGKCFAIMDANPFPIMLEAEDSPVRGKVGYLLPPSGLKGSESFLWIWSLGINSFSKHKAASWLFIQWVTSKHTLRKAIDYSNWMTPRQSVWLDPKVKTFLSEVDNGRWYENSTLLVTKLAAMRWSPTPLAATLGDLWAGAIQDAWRGKCTVEEGLNKAASEFDALMQQSGYIK
ncbi:MAG: extracellular solute-binding protein [Desulfobacterales bacterium]|nr:extracellular solute-binding protein [Desulfobacterales bacterium]